MKKTILNPDKEIVDAIRARLKITGNMCPCIPESQWTRDHICPCKEFRENQYCCCQLYITQESEEN